MVSKASICEGLRVNGLCRTLSREEESESESERERRVFRGVCVCVVLTQPITQHKNPTLVSNWSKTN